MTATAQRQPIPPVRARRRLPVSNFVAKTTMAVTGLIFVGFVFVHMYGNLHIYRGQEEFDHYAHWLREILMPLVPYEGVLWILRVVLLVSLLLHVGFGILLWSRARRARGAFPRKGLRRPDALLARYMLGTGVVLLLFVVFHVLDLTLGVQPAASGAFERGSAYANLVASFQRPLVAAFYMLTMLVLTAHVAHGTWTAANDLGATGKRLRQVAAWVAGLVAVAICLGNISIPIMVLLGVIQ
ncbi:succinate dehydrogenase cytochrome b subunit [Kocuria sp.]|uniref:succinate dehydrogenase cytochrome b subunit n=1 Tax=Kocuria sp. TaxID=1871328 RepID=UPI0026DB07A8|nr:succinate dehydrogenase cytochrome b subunit [Kocuria sp.]MDO4918792.1 succinate dehydrogenase cytochrome b subunit [Kocuria sp.]